jgi:hypothetical protein
MPDTLQQRVVIDWCLRVIIIQTLPNKVNVSWTKGRKPLNRAVRNAFKRKSTGGRQGCHLLAPDGRRQERSVELSGEPSLGYRC